MLSRLETVSEIHSPVHPCIRDIWHDHVLFHQDQVTGIVDFGALRVDHAAVDIARLLGSLVVDDRKSWRYGLAAYQQIRGLTPQELQLVEVADESNMLLSGMNWLRWIYVEGRQFTARPVILQRLEGILARMQLPLGVSCQSGPPGPGGSSAQVSGILEKTRRTRRGPASHSEAAASPAIIGEEKRTVPFCRTWQQARGDADTAGPHYHVS